jgi:hypothetical protein
MTNDEEHLRQHWQELAEQLGIEASPPAPPTEEKQAVSVSYPSAVTRAANKEASETTTEKEPPSAGAADFQEPAAPPWGQEREGIEEHSPQAISSQEEPEVAPQRRQARRSARGTKQRRAVDQARPEMENRNPSEEMVDEESAPRARRRRKETPPDHRERTEELSPFSDETESEEAAAAPQLSEEEADKDDLDTLTDWNVPSWTELIDSLYRPD